MDYSQLVEVYSKLESTTKKLEKTEIIAGLLERADKETLPKLALLVQGRLFPSWGEKDLGIADQLMAKMMAKTTGFTEDEINQRYNKTGDLGLVIEEVIQKKRQQTLLQKKLTVDMVYSNLRKLPEMEGKGSQDRKFNLVSELLGSARPEEAKYIVRTVLGELRIGVAKGLVRDAIARAFFTQVHWDPKKIIHLIKNSKEKKFWMEKGLLENLQSKKGLNKKNVEEFKEKNQTEEKTKKRLKDTDKLWKKDSGPDFLITLDSDLGKPLKEKIVDTVEWAWFLRSDYGEIAKIARESGLKGLKETDIKLGRPIKVLLAEKSPTLKEALESYAKPVVEIKYDGARIQIHKKGKKIWLFTRRLEDVTEQFPDIVRMAKKQLEPKTCLVEGEILGVNRKSGKPIPFQELSHRIHRKYDIKEMVEKIPVHVNLFDIVYLDGKTLFQLPFSDRRKRLESAVKETKDFRLAAQLETKEMEEAQKFYQKALDAGQEGVMVKNQDAKYQPGRRVAGGWLKVKPTLETLDLAVIGAHWGTGKRAGWLGSLILGCRDPETGDFLECGMMGTGIKEKKEQPGDVTFKEITDMLKPHIKRETEDKVIIKPKVVVEVAYEEIQKSPNYESKYALRFPRFLKIREDKGPEEADDLERLKKIYQRQKGRESS